MVQWVNRAKIPSIRELWREQIKPEIGLLYIKLATGPGEINSSWPKVKNKVKLRKEGSLDH